jgi:uncharacterized membrane protein YgcG
MKRLVQLTLLTVLSLFSGAMAQVSTSHWQAVPIAIDGDGSDWGTNPRFFNAESNVKYEFRNDAQNLYLIIKSADRAVQMQLLKAGFSIKLKVKTTPPIRTIISFPAGKSPEKAPVINNEEARADKLMDKSVTNQETMLKDTAILDGFQFSKGKISSENRDEKSICFARSKSLRELTYYEIRIPLREIFGNDYVMKAISEVPIQLQVTINELSQNEIRKMRTKGGGRGGMGGGHGGGRGGMGGGRNGGMGGDLQSQQENDMPGGNIGGEMENMDGNANRGGSSMDRKSFSIDFHLTPLATN